MTEPAFHIPSTEQPPPQDDAPPEFGLVDVVEAFTAMRHEWRGQTKEIRAATDAIRQAVTSIEAADANRSKATVGSEDEARRLAELVAENDHQLTRIVAAAERVEAGRTRREDAAAQAIERRFEAMNPIARWFARPLAEFIAGQRESGRESADTAAVEGLTLSLAQLRRMMKERQIERVDTVGQPFDAKTMNAIGTVPTEAFPSGHVAEQLSPCYRWRGEVLRFADVRVVA
ncbi:MAG: nucleotide exchange factor GrpE [Planctomycetota bacterium]